MAIYPPNQTTPAKGSGNYLWNWLGSSLKKFGAAISPYITGGDPYKKYVALLTQENTDPPVATYIIENTIGSITYSYLGVGSYILTLPEPVLYEKLVVITGVNSQQDPAILSYRMAGGYPIIPGYSSDTIYLSTFDLYTQSDSDQRLYLTPIEIRVYP